MNITTSTEDLELSRLRADHPGHRIWRSVRYDGEFGDWVATLHDPAAGVDPTVICDDPEEPRVALAAEKMRAVARSRETR